jgi:hypothetical protein
MHVFSSTVILVYLSAVNADLLLNLTIYQKRPHQKRSKYKKCPTSPSVVCCDLL